VTANCSCPLRGSSRPPQRRLRQEIAVSSLRKSVVVLNSSAETIELLATWFEGEGMLVHAASVTAFRKGERDFAQFIAAAAPDVVIFDVALPYMLNWQFLQEGREAGPLNGIPVIVTTPNEEVLRTICNVSNAESTHEIVGKPLDMQQLTRKVMALLAAGV
jgi:CheY-like chemotaxis protein